VETTEAVKVLLGILSEFSNMNSSGDEIANMNFYAEITQNNAITPFNVIQGHRFWYQ